MTCLSHMHSIQPLGFDTNSSNSFDMSVSHAQQQHDGSVSSSLLSHTHNNTMGLSLLFSHTHNTIERDIEGEKEIVIEREKEIETEKKIERHDQDLESIHQYLLLERDLYSLLLLTLLAMCHYTVSWAPSKFVWAFPFIWIALPIGFGLGPVFYPSTRIMLSYLLQDSYRACRIRFKK
ncbi:unnamed protein product [Camellia sinensis]